jgi:hypothetical protein
MTTIEAFVRFSDSDGEVHYGEVSQQQLAASDLHGLSVNVLDGTPFSGFQRLDQKKSITKVRRPKYPTYFAWKKERERENSSLGFSKHRRTLFDRPQT